MEQAVASFYKGHRRDFETSEAQRANRIHDEEMAGQFIYANIHAAWYVLVRLRCLSIEVNEFHEEKC